FRVIEALVVVHSVLPFVCFERFTEGSSSRDSRRCQTLAASPAEPGGLPVTLARHRDAGATRRRPTCRRLAWHEDRSPGSGRRRGGRPAARAGRPGAGAAGRLLPGGGFRGPRF